MGVFLRVGGLGLLLGSLVGCGGSEFSADGETGGSDSGAGGSADAGGAGGSGGQGGSGGTADAGADAPPNNCTSELFQKTCMDSEVTTGNGVCDTCGRGQCCAPTNACLADEVCAQELRCYLANCLGQSALACVPAQCVPCLGGTAKFYAVSSCLQSKCTPDCPMLIP